MKKIVLASLMSLVAFSALAAEVRIEGQNAQGQNGTADQRVFELGVKESFTSNLAGDLVVKNYQTDNTNTLATRIEGGLTASQTFNAGVAVTPYVRGAIGEKFVSGSTGFSYYSVEPGVSAALGNGVSASLGWRFQDAFDSAKNDQTRTWRAKLGYDIAKNSTVYIGYDVQRGDSDQNITKVGFVQRF